MKPTTGHQDTSPGPLFRFFAGDHPRLDEMLLRATAANAPFLFVPIARLVFIALAAWAATFIGLMRHLIGTMFARTTPA